MGAWAVWFWPEGWGRGFAWSLGSIILSTNRENTKNDFGNNKIKGLVSTLTEIYGGVGDGVEACSKEVDHGDVINVGTGVSCSIDDSFSCSLSAFDDF